MTRGEKNRLKRIHYLVVTAAVILLDLWTK